MRLIETFNAIGEDGKCYVVLRYTSQIRKAAGAQGELLSEDVLRLDSGQGVYAVSGSSDEYVIQGSGVRLKRRAV